MSAIIGMMGCSSQNHKDKEMLPPLPAQSFANSTKSIQLHSIKSTRRPVKPTKFHLKGVSEDKQVEGASRQGMHRAVEADSREAIAGQSLSSRRQPVRGIYVSGWVAGSKHRLDRLIQLVDKTDLNAMVIDVKNDYGQLTYRSSLPAVKAIGADRHVAINDISGLICKLKAKNIYVIGRVVAFKDPLYAKQYPAMALQKRNGGVWHDVQGKAWLDPFQSQVRTYNIAIAEEAAAKGFDEIQFDYVRFPDNGGKVDREVRYYNPRGKSKAQMISTFLSSARHQLHVKGARVSADVFGLVTSSTNDMGIGQSWRSISGAVDVISPMTYPSHYSTGMYGVKQPDLSPYAIIHHAMADAQHRNAIMRQSGHASTAQVRPWLQSFTAKWVHPHQTYGAEQVNKQVQAARDQGIDEFLLWSSNCKYDYRSLF
ncbi:putative glycoside hydrolase [Paenibacillus rhizovicinus]|uniref:Putative glycoside hydrolase n=2 Tax=Paenibacillus rhizovicinus TaxID=2704463 RepID=A0A6C0P9V0_9BACL|nr:putative glycoside hydrolase [Paenibacillus rhizovicinus]